MRIDREAVQSLIRMKVSESPLKSRGSCGCGRKFSDLYYFWWSEVTGEKYCMFCYAQANRAFNEVEKSYHTEQTMYGLLQSWRSPELSLKETLKERKEMDGIMPKCKACARTCKIPYSPNVDVFFCDNRKPLIEFDMVKIEKRLGV